MVSLTSMDTPCCRHLYIQTNIGFSLVRPFIFYAHQPGKCMRPFGRNLIIDRLTLSRFRGAFLALVLLLASPSGALAWEEADKKAFEEKIGILAEIINKQRAEIDTSSPSTTRADLRTQCLLQSIGIDVVKRYLDFNPNDQWWQQKYSRLRDDLTACLGLLYNM